MLPASPASRIADLKPAFAPQEALVEANRCLFCFDAPCTIACPTHIDVPRFIKKIATGNLRGSASTILEANVLGLSCSRVCPVDILCEGSCVMHRYNRQPIEIGRLQRHAMEDFYDKGAHWALPTVEARTRKVACIGAGPASLACAAELRRHGFAVTIFDAHPLGGGLNTYGVAEYKFRPNDSQREVDFIRSLGVEIRTGESIGTDLPLDRLEKEFDFIFIGMGLGPTEKLNIPGEDFPNVIDAVSFIAAYKTAADVRVGRNVAVIGAGNTAIDAAVAARLLGAAQVTIVYRRTEKELPAFEFEYEHAKLEGVRFLWNVRPERIESDGIHLVETTSGSESHFACDMVIVALGQTKLTHLFGPERGIRFMNGRVVVNPLTGQTDNPRYFAGGDCVNGGREVVDAAAEGKRAGQGIANG
jgi:dihydropyrimidine dehydrogenase (NAD+) subunit PreT